jgi:hypothetical protein
LNWALVRIRQAAGTDLIGVMMTGLFWPAGLVDMRGGGGSSCGPSLGVHGWNCERRSGQHLSLRL